MLYEQFLFLNQPLLGKQMSFEDKVREACFENEIPGVVLAADGPGKARFLKAFGTHVSKEDGSGRPLEVDSTFHLSSCSQLMTTVAALQCVERGIVTLDEDVTRVLPELTNPKILTGFDRRTQQPIFIQRRRQLTLRHLLTHTSGISHPSWNCLLYDYLTSQYRPVGLHPKGKITTTCLYPLIFEPGTSWEYGAGIEWAGKMVERLNGNISLQRYMEINIWIPLNMTSATFRISDRPDLKEKLPELMYRQGLNHPIYGTTMSPSGQIVSGSDYESAMRVTVEELPDDHMNNSNFNSQGHDDDDDDDFGGNGIYCSAPDFTKMLSSLCTNDSQLLHLSTINEMFRPQLGPEARARLQRFFTIKQLNNIFAGGLLPTSSSPSPLPPLDWGLGGMLVMEDVTTPSSTMTGSRPSARRRKGSLFWAGLPNLYWWMDRQAAVSGFYASQLRPQGDPRSIEILGDFERWVYERAGLAVGKGEGTGISASS